MPVCATAVPSSVTATASSSTRWDDALLRRYDKSGPRYTSYPTALAFHEGFTAEDATQAIERSTQVSARFPSMSISRFVAKSAFIARAIKLRRKTPPWPSRISIGLDREMGMSAPEGKHQTPWPTGESVNGPLASPQAYHPGERLARPAQQCVGFPAHWQSSRWR